MAWHYALPDEPLPSCVKKFSSWAQPQSTEPSRTPPMPPKRKDNPATQPGLPKAKKKKPVLPSFCIPDASSSSVSSSWKAEDNSPSQLVTTQSQVTTLWTNPSGCLGYHTTDGALTSASDTPKPLIPKPQPLALADMTGPSSASSEKSRSKYQNTTKVSHC